jgi:hypothetical protein
VSPEDKIRDFVPKADVIKIASVGNDRYRVNLFEKTKSLIPTLKLTQSFYLHCDGKSVKDLSQ